MQVIVIGGKTYINGRPVTRFVCNGCGSSWSWWLVVDWLPFLPMRAICCTHDLAYVCGGSENDRQLADNFFKASILSFCKGRSRPVRWFIRRVANARWFVVRSFGWHTSFVYTKSGKPRTPVEIEGEYYFYDDEQLCKAD